MYTSTPLFPPIAPRRASSPVVIPPPLHTRGRASGHAPGHAPAHAGTRPPIISVPDARVTPRVQKKPESGTGRRVPGRVPSVDERVPSSKAAAAAKPSSTQLRASKPSSASLTPSPSASSVASTAPRPAADAALSLRHLRLQQSQLAEQRRIAEATLLAAQQARRDAMADYNAAVEAMDPQTMMLLETLYVAWRDLRNRGAFEGLPPVGGGDDGDKAGEVFAPVDEGETGTVTDPAAENDIILDETLALFCDSTAGSVLRLDLLSKRERWALIDEWFRLLANGVE